jgi:hypothetical protein
MATRRVEGLTATDGAALVHDLELLVLDQSFSGLHPVPVDVPAALLRRGAAVGARSCSPATSSTWSSGCATTS